MHIPYLLALCTLHLSLITATDLTLPTLHDHHNLTSHLEKRASCGDGTSCLIGSCCGDGCAMNCCAMDNGGLGCGITERCQFKGDVFVGCCGNLLGGCTGEATRVTVHTPYHTVTLNPSADISITSDVAITSTEKTQGYSVSETSTLTLTLPSLSSTRRDTNFTETAGATTTTTTMAATTTPSDESESEETATSVPTDRNGNGNVAGGSGSDSGEGGFSQMPNGAGRVRSVFGMGMGVVLGILGVI